MNLTHYDFIVINSSAGKDSQAMTHLVCKLAREQGVLNRVLMVHADLGRVEWSGTKDLAELHSATYGIPLTVVRREKGDLLVQIELRGKFPDSENRYCTSDQKRDQIAKVFTALCGDRKHTRILNCMGLRAQESVARAKKKDFSNDTRQTNGRRR